MVKLLNMILPRQIIVQSKIQGFPGFFLPHATALAIIKSPVLTKAIWETG